MGWLAQGLDGRFGSGLFAAVCGVVLIGAGARAGSPTFTELYDAQVRDGAELFGERRGAIDRAIDLAEVGAERRVVTMQTPHNPDDKYARIYLRDRALLDDGSLRIRNYELNEGESGVVLVGEWITDEAELFVALPELVRLTPCTAPMPIGRAARSGACTLRTACSPKGLTGSRSTKRMKRGSTPQGPGIRTPTDWRRSPNRPGSC